MARESRRERSSRVRIGMCINDECELAKSKQRQSIRQGHDFVCESCGCELRECVEERKTSKAPIIIGAVIVLLVVGLSFVFMGGNEQDDLAQPEVETATEAPSLNTEEKAETAQPEVEMQTEPMMIEGGIDFGYAVYKGKVKDGKMNSDNGVLTFKKKHIIEPRDVKKRMANPGEKVVGMFEDGHLTTGTWYKNDGNKEMIIP